LARQKGRLAPFRNYALADSLLNAAYATANEALSEARYRIASLSSTASLEISDLRNELAVWHEALNGSLVTLSAGEHLSKADLALKMSESLFSNNEYEAAIKTIDQARQSLAILGELIGDHVENEKREIKSWRRWVDETLKESIGKKSAAIIVDKSAHKLYLARNGKPTLAFDCEIGYNSAGQKLFSGDGATPEGKYHITGIRNSGSKFYKALPIDYPSPGDKKLFNNNKAKGIITRRARIGAFIEIHGEGGKGKDWTNGCVALKNEDINRLIPHVTVGTPVTIVRRSDKWP